MFCVFYVHEKLKGGQLSLEAALSAIHNSTTIMNTILVTDRIEVVVHRVPEAPPQWLLDGRAPVQSPLPIQYDFTEPVKLSFVQWLLRLLKR